MARCFVIQPFDKDKFDRRYTDVYEPAVKAAGFEPYRIDRDPSVDVPIDEIERGIRDSALCLADITVNNPNVWYEVGFAYAESKPMCLICSDERKDPFPFDIQHRSILRYKTGSSSDFEELKLGITTRIQALSDRVQQVANLAERSPFATTGGLTPYEIAAMCILVEHDIYSDGTTSGESLKQAMEAAGFNGVAAGLSISSLERQGFAKTELKRESNGYRDEYTYKVIALTERGRQWLLENTDKISLVRKAGGTPARARDPIGDDIPF